MLRMHKYVSRTAAGHTTSSNTVQRTQMLPVILPLHICWMGGFASAYCSPCKASMSAGKRALRAHQHPYNARIGILAVLRSPRVRKTESKTEATLMRDLAGLRRLQHDTRCRQRERRWVRLGCARQAPDAGERTC